MLVQEGSAAARLSPVYRLVGEAETWSDWRKAVRLIHHLTKRHLAARYRGSVLGFGLSFLNPLLMMGIYSFVFQYVFRATVPGLPYPVFFLTGLLAWIFFTTASMNASTSIVDNVTLISQTYFPRIVLPLSAICSNAVNYLVTIPLLLVFNLCFGVVPDLSILLLPLALLLILFTATGIGLIAASLTVFFRDVLQLLDVVFMAWFFATPILYPMSFLDSSLPAGVLTLYQLNPMVGAVGLMRAVFLGMPVPMAAVVWSAGGATCLLGIGVWGFLRLSRGFADA